MTPFICTCIVTAGWLLADNSTGYPNGRLLIEPSELAQRLNDKDLIILDCRTQEKYRTGHIPQARWVDVSAWSKAFGNGSDTEGWAKRLGELGLRPDAEIVIYDDSKSVAAARVWWILRYWGFTNVRLLNGGWVAWQAANLPSSTQPTSAPAPTTVQLQPKREVLAVKDQVLECLSKPSCQIVDARSEDEFCGKTKLSKRGGAMPGAKHLEWSDLLDEKTHRFKSAEEIRRLFAKAGIDLDKPTVAHCQSGGRSSVMAFALELMGAKNVQNYYAGWAEWGNAEDTPIVTPPSGSK